MLAHYTEQEGDRCCVHRIESLLGSASHDTHDYGNVRGTLQRDSS